jgi:hypothetical protein
MNTATRSIRRVADQVVSKSLNDALAEVFSVAPGGRVGPTLKAYLQAVRERLEWMESRAPF